MHIQLLYAVETLLHHSLFLRLEEKTVELYLQNTNNVFHKAKQMKR